MILTLVLLAAPSFTNHGQPIHPKCVSALVVGEGAPSVYLATCGSVKGRVVTTKDDRSWVEPGAERPESVSYRVVGSVGDDWLVSWSWSGGGSGRFTGLSVLRVSKSGVLRVVKSITGGDRCNGGLAKVSIEKGAVRFAVHATPIDVVSATPEGRALALDSLQLEVSAMSCFATIEYLDGALAAATLEADAPEDRPGWTDRYRLQGCYNALQRDYAMRGKLSLDRAAFVDFVTAFRRKCVERDAH